MTSFSELMEQAEDHPTITQLPPLAEFYLDDLAIYRSFDEFHRDFYDPDYQFDRDVLIDDDIRHPDFPRVNCTADSVTPALNNTVEWTNPEHHDRMQQELLCQSDIKDYIRRTVLTEDLVVLVIVDGLSYDAVQDLDWEMQPVVVDGLTTTEPGFRRIIYGGDSVSICAALLNEKEFYNPFGFTYWERGQEDLSTDLHSAMGNSVERISDFEETLTTLRSEAPFEEKTYVQITRMGFDQHCHNRKEEPNRDAIREELIADAQQLEQTVRDITDDYRIFITSDHGILWRDQLPDDPNIVCDDYENHARFLSGDRDLPQGLTKQTAAGDIATALGYPYLTREFKNTEWGVHGGFSYHESIVPLIELSNTGDST